jgi:hypothetical protein
VGFVGEIAPAITKQADLPRTFGCAYKRSP